jgi:DtxR family Mn-dependent transcriptional regulator
MISTSIENYLKCIYQLEEQLVGERTDSTKGITTGAIADRMETQAPSVSDMLRKLSERGWATYEKYQGTHLTFEGRKIAVDILRKHRLGEVFLVEKLGFKWDEVHDIAEQLEHVVSEDLVDRLDAWLGHPQFDPHGDPIPDKKGVMRDKRKKKSLHDMQSGEAGVLVGLGDTSDTFLRYLDSFEIALGTRITIVERFEFDGSVRVLSNDKDKLTLSSQVAANLLLITP